MLLWLTRGASRSGPTLVGLVLFRDGAPSRVSTILWIWGLLWVGLIWAYGQGIGVAQESAQLIKAIKIQGNKRIEAPAIRGRISLKEGEPFSAEKIREQIRAIYQMGYFEDVRVETEPVAGGVAVMFVVSEKPFVTQIL